MATISKKATWKNLIEEEWLKGFNEGIQDLKSGLITEECPNSFLQEGLESSPHRYTKYFVKGYLSAVSQFRGLPV
jgi:hypothetical protein